MHSNTTFRRSSSSSSSSSSGGGGGGGGGGVARFHNRTQATVMHLVNTRSLLSIG